MPGRIFQILLVVFLLLILPQSYASAEDRDTGNGNGLAVEVGYGNAFAGMGVGGEGMINVDDNINLSLLASYGYMEEVSGYALGGRMLYGSNHRLFLEYTYGLIGYEKGEVIENNEEDDVEEEVYGSSISLGYQYIHRSGILGLSSLGISMGQGEYENSIDASTFNLGIGYKF